MGLLAIVLVAVVGVVGLFSVLRSPQRMGLRSIATAPSGDLGDVAADLTYDSLAVLKGYGHRPVPRGLPSLESLRFDPAKERTGITFVSAALNIGRKSHRTVTADESKYKFEDDYIERLNHLLAWGEPTEVVIEKRYESHVRFAAPTKQRVRFVEVDELRRDFRMYDAVQRIRANPKWVNQVGWLRDAPQANNDLYNAVVMSKLYWLADLCDRNPFNTEYFVWLDAGICTRTMISPRNLEVLKRRMRAYMRTDRFWICHAPYPHANEIHGFSRPDIHHFAGGHRVEVVPKGGMFGGTCKAIKDVLVAYDDVLVRSLEAGFMGTEESLFAILHYTHPHLFEPCANERPESPRQEQMCLFLDDNYLGFGDSLQLRYRESALYSAA